MCLAYIEALDVIYIGLPGIGVNRHIKESAFAADLVGVSFLDTAVSSLSVEIRTTPLFGG